MSNIATSEIVRLDIAVVKAKINTLNQELTKLQLLLRGANEEESDYALQHNLI